MSSTHHACIIDQFSRQSVTFTQLPGHYDALDIVLRLSGVTARDNVLDIACGPGIVSCALAAHARHVTGLDLTPAMLAQARQRQQASGLHNLAWQCGDALNLPFADGEFARVITRYSFHHLTDTAQALREMIRVCQPGGTVLVADVAIPDHCVAAYDQLERWRDPSHTHALSEREFDELFAQSGLLHCQYASYDVDLELEAQLRASFPLPGDEERIRQAVTDDIERQQRGIRAYRSGDDVRYRVPVRVYAGQRPV